MITVTLEDQSVGVAVLLNDANDAPYYPTPTVGAARVVLYARDSDKGVDAAFIIAEGKPGGEFSIPYAALTGRDMLFATVTYSASGTPSVSDLEHADWETLPVAVGTIEVTDIDADTVAATSGDIDTFTSQDIDGALIKGDQVRIGTGGTTLTKMVKGTVTVNPASVAANSVSTQTFTLTGAMVGDSLQLNPPAAGLTTGLVVLPSWVSAADTVSIVFQNTTASPIDEPSGSWTYTLIRS